jgi:hypothetical protein
MLVFAQVITGGKEAEGIRELAFLLRAFDERANVINECGGFVNIDAGLFVGVLGHEERVSGASRHRHLEIEAAQLGCKSGVHRSPWKLPQIPALKSPPRHSSCGMKAVLTCLLATFLMAVPSFAAEPHTPKKGDPERTEIMEALRVPVTAELKRDVIFKVDRLKVLEGWAFLGGVPLKPDGSEMDYKGTVHEEAIREGAFDGGIFALLRKREGKWTTVRFIIGATDVPYVDWPSEFKAPASIFPR